MDRQLFLVFTMHQESCCMRKVRQIRQNERPEAAVLISERTTLVAAAAVYLRQKIDAHSARMALFFSLLPASRIVPDIYYSSPVLPVFVSRRKHSARLVYIEKFIEPAASITSSTDNIR